MGVKLKEYKEWRNSNLSLFFNSLKTHFVFGFFYLAFFGVYAQEAPSWVDFCSKKGIGDTKNSVLLDYSYAGYHFSEKSLSDTSTWDTISVLDYGANPNDNGYDDASIQAAIDAAEASNTPTVVYFPEGKYLISSEATKNKPIEVNKSHIVLKGAGSHKGGTEIYAVNFGDISKRWHSPWQFSFKPSNEHTDHSPSPISHVKNGIHRGNRVIEVDKPENIRVGMLVSLNKQIKKQNDFNLKKIELHPEWNIINKEGVDISEKHLITKIEGNKVTFKNPINYSIDAKNHQINLYSYNTIEEVGVEDILFTSAWKEYPEDFVHHANDVVDYAWRAIFFKNVFNGWIRNVKFRDWNDCVQIRGSLAITVNNVEISGKRGHASFMAYNSTGVLIENSKDLVSSETNRAGGQRHGPAFQSGATGCVYRNIKLQKNQSVDCHGYYPYGNLFDNVYGGSFDRNGAAKRAYPNSGPDLVFWNFVHASDYESKEFNFWDLETHKIHTYLKPKFIGFTSPEETINFKNEGLDEMHGTQVYPQSLFDAQLQLRLYDVYVSASSEKEGFEAKNCVDDNQNNFWTPKSNQKEDNYLILDFGKNKAVTAVLLKEAHESINKLSVKYWENGIWHNVNATMSTDNKGRWELDKEINTRKVKLLIKKVNHNTEIKVTKIEAV